MNKQELIREVRKLIGEAKPGEALLILTNTLSNESAYKAYYRVALQLKSQYEKIKKEEQLGIVSFDNAQLAYNQITNAILELAEQLENGTPPPQKRKKTWWVASSLGVLGIVAAAAFFLLSGNESNDCPVFTPQSAFNILLLPFEQLAGEKAFPHRAIKDRLIDFSTKFKLSTEIGTLELEPNDDNRYPSNYGQAEKLGDGCRAQLIIWGTYETQIAGRNLIRTRYKFIDSGEKFAFSQINMEEDSKLDTVSSISSISTEGVLTLDIEEQISMLLLGVVAHQIGDSKSSIDLLESISTPDSATLLLWGMTLADNYIATNNTDKAAGYYDKILKTHPNYGFALKNRAMINFSKGNYGEAVEDLNTRLEEVPQDTVALKARANIFLKNKRPDKAEKDISAYEQLNPKDHLIDKLRDQLSAQIKEQETLKTKADNTLSYDGNNLEALKAKANASLSLGDYQAASKAAEQYLKKRPKDAEVIGTLIEAKKAVNPDANVETILEKAQKDGVSKEEVIRKRPILSRVIKRQ
ncbi:MAG: hypothetical protein DHS20C18_18550 [Saprospiraceae bacterium]|nr:MAG: hypothetical protein DHS20C18_18550 [Saprospiraceae bacterium]